MTEKSYAKKSKAQLIREIRRDTLEANKRLLTINNPSRALSAEIEHLKIFGGYRGGRLTQSVRGKSHAQLVQQARELKYFLEWDVESEYGARQEEERFKMAYKEFMTNYPDSGYTEDEYRRLTETTGALGEDFIQANYDSDDIKELYKNAKAEGKEDYVLSALEESVDKEKGLSRTERIDDVYRRLGITL